MADRAADRETAWLLHRGVDLLPSMLAYWDDTLTCRYANRAYELWFGVDPDALIGTSLHDLLGPELFALNEPYIRGALQGREQTFERVIPGPNGARRPSLAHYVPDIVDGVVRGFLVQVTEVSQLKAVELALRDEIALHENTARQLAASEASLHRAQALGQVGSWEWDCAADTTRWSPELYRIFGLDSARPAPAYAEHAKLWTADSWSQMQQAFATALEYGTSYCLELQYVKPDGSLGWLEARGECVLDPDGRITGLRGTAQVVTDRKAGAAAHISLILAQQKRRDRALLLSCISERIRTSLNSVSGYAYLLRGDRIPREDTLRWADRIAEGSRQVIDLLSAMESPTFSLFGDEESQQIPVSLGIESKTPNPDADSRLATEAANLGVWRWDLKSDVVLWENARMYEIFGLDAGASTVNAAALISEFVHEDDAERLRTELAEVMSGGKGLHFVGRIRRRSDQTFRWIEIIGRHQPDASGRLLIGIVADITERKHLEENAKRSEERLAALMDVIPCPALVYDDAGTILLVSKALTHITGYRPEDIPTRSEWARLAYREDDARDIAARLETVVKTEQPGDGGERTVRTKTGETRIWQLFAAPAGVSLDGRRIIVAIGNDVTERKRDEEALCRMKARSEGLLALLAQELRPPLTALVDAASVVQQVTPEIPAIRQAADTLARQTQHIARLVDDLLEDKQSGPPP